MLTIIIYASILGCSLALGTSLVTVLRQRDLQTRLNAIEYRLASINAPASTLLPNTFSSNEE